MAANALAGNPGNYNEPTEPVRTIPQHESGKSFLEIPENTPNNYQNTLKKNIDSIKNNYPHDGTIQHKIFIEIGEHKLKEKTGELASQKEGYFENQSPAAPKGHPSAALTAPRPQYSENYLKLFPAGAVTLHAQSGMLASQILREFVKKYDFQLQWKSAYDCRTKNQFSIKRNDVVAVLGEFLKLFSLSAQLVTNDKYVVITSSGVDSETCEPGPGIKYYQSGGIIN